MTAIRDRTAWLQGDFLHCLQPPTRVGRAWRLVLLGPPGVGKGTQAQLLADTLGACPLSTGDLFRAALEHSHPPHSPMAEACERMLHGQFVPDDLVLGLMQARRTCLRCSGGFLLHGFPRTLVQAAALEGMLERERVALDAVISYTLPPPELMTRLGGRRICPECHALYHVTTRAPRTPGICDHCGARLEQRPDDRPAALRTRLHHYAEATAQVENYYRAQKLLVEIDASATPETVFARTLEHLVARGLPPSCAPA
jgi:adenylate kinase